MDANRLKSIRKTACEEALDLMEFFTVVHRTLAKHRINASINPLFLADACESCFIDLERHKDFHRLDIADRHKMAAFLFKWLAKVRPIAISSYVTDTNADYALHINSYFALMAALGELNMDIYDFESTPVYKHIIYAASYREINAQNWAITFCLLEASFS